METAGVGPESRGLLSAEDEVRLARQIEAGLLAREALAAGRWPGATPTELWVLVAEGEEARHRFVQANLRLVRSVVYPSARRSRLPESDLFQEGCLGLIMAVQRFDWQRPVRFATYALYWIRAHVSAATARSLGAANLPASRAAQLRVARGVAVGLSQSLGREATLAEMAAAVGHSERWTADLLAYRVPQSLDLVEADQLPAPGPQVEEVLDRDRPGAELLLCLDELSRRVLTLRLGFEGDVHSYVQTARRLGLSVSRVRRLEDRALETLRSVCPQSASVHL